MSKTICIFGDSIVHGAGVADYGSWAQRLKMYCRRNKNENPASFYNLGISGNTTTNLLGRLELESKSRNPKVIIFAIGINDSVYYEDGSVFISEQEFENNLEKLIQIARKFVDEVTFVGLTLVAEEKLQPYPNSTSNKSYSRERVRIFDAIIKNICEKSNIKYISMQDIFDKRFLPDGLHPNTEWHKKIFERVRDFLIVDKII